MKTKNVLEVIVCSNDSSRLIGFAGNCDSGIADSDWGNGFDLIYLFDCGDILNSKVGLGVLASAS